MSTSYEGKGGGGSGATRSSFVKRLRQVNDHRASYPHTPPDVAALRAAEGLPASAPVAGLPAPARRQFFALRFVTVCH